MTLAEAALLAAAGFAAGMLNTVAGGGTFLTFPALVLTGVPPVIANATSAVAVLPGYLAGAIGFRAELAAVPRPMLARLTAVTLAGGLAGSLLLMISSNEVFSMIVPGLLLFATLLFLFGDRVRPKADPAGAGDSAAGMAGLLAVSLYGGYFNGGLGIMLLALFSLWGMRDLHRMNGLKSGLSFALSAISVAAFALAGLVVWPEAALMMAMATLGGYLGAPVARMIPRALLRALIATIGFGMTIAFALRAWT